MISDSGWDRIKKENRRRDRRLSSSHSANLLPLAREEGTLQAIRGKCALDGSATRKCIFEGLKTGFSLSIVFSFHRTSFQNLHARATGAHLCRQAISQPQQRKGPRLEDYANFTTG